jgi:aminoglycoside N3'-acetyltransferase
MSKARREVSVAEVVTQLDALGVAVGDVLLVHSSFRAVRPVEQGPAGLIEALSQSIGPGGTLVMPSWTGDDDRPFAPATTPASPDLGIVADTFWRLPLVRRARHPFAFAARGPKAARILSDSLALPPHQRNSPVGKVLDCDGKILLLGVDHDANTTLHLAELLAGVPYRSRKHITVLHGDEPTRIDYLENDHCCQLFKLANAWLKERGAQSEGTVGHASAKLMRSRDLIDTALCHLERNPFALIHPRDAGCEECAEAWRSIHG